MAWFSVTGGSLREALYERFEEAGARLADDECRRGGLVGEDIGEELRGKSR